MAGPRRDGSARLQAAWLSRGSLAWSLRPLALLFGIATGLRRWLYGRGWLKTHGMPVPVVVVGNLVVGGAGKTPTVLAVVDLLRRQGFTPGIVSRGHGRQGDGLVDVAPATAAAECGDEPLLLRLRSGAPVVVGRRRVAAAHELLRRHPQVDIVIADDGLQHLALGRTAQVLVFDERGAGNGWLLPAGPLREALPHALAPGSVVLYNAAAATTPLPGSLAHPALTGAAELRAWRAGRPATLAALHALRGRPLVAAAGLARPARFFDMLREHGLAFDALPLSDHHAFRSLPWTADTADVVLTEKDAVKLDPDRLGVTRVWVAALDFAPDADFASALTALLPAPHRNPDRHGSAPA